MIYIKLVRYIHDTRMKYFIRTLSHVECYVRHLVQDIQYLEKYIEFLPISRWYNLSFLLVFPLLTNKLPERRLAPRAPEEICVCEESPGFVREGKSVLYILCWIHSLRHQISLL